MSRPTTDSVGEGDDSIGLGDLVAIVLPGSTLAQPLVELGQILRINADQTQFRYVPFQNIGGSTYRCQVGHVGRAAQKHRVFPIGAGFDEEAKVYKLLVDLLEIHNARDNSQ